VRSVLRWGFVVLGFVAIAVFSDARGADDGLRLVVWKRRHVLEVHAGEKVIRRYRVSLGLNPTGAKERRGDRKTPVGSYYVYEKRPSERFRWFLALNYPAIGDADRAFGAGRISADVWADIWIADRFRQRPPWNTPLGAFVGIHGTGAAGNKAKLRQVSDWTDGCVALSDRDIDELYEMTPVGTPVEIRE
jgi:murein L,D-transpeptidase YafK